MPGLSSLVAELLDLAGLPVRRLTRLTRIALLGIALLAPAAFADGLMEHATGKTDMVVKTVVEPMLRDLVPAVPAEPTATTS